jgi:hypothetical protein
MADSPYGLLVAGAAGEGDEPAEQAGAFSARAAAPKYVTDPIRWSASWVTSNSVHTVGLW